LEADSHRREGRGLEADSHRREGRGLEAAHTARCEDDARTGFFRKPERACSLKFQRMY